MITLTNETQTILSFLRIFKFNTVMYYLFIIILLLLFKKYIYYYIYFMYKN